MATLATNVLTRIIHKYLITKLITLYHTLKQKYDSSIVHLKEELSTPQKIVITTHQGPDGDAMGSSLALFHFLKKQSHDVSVITPNDYPDFLRWLPSNNEVINYMHRKKTAEALIESATYIFYLDYNHIKRSADMVRSLTKSKAVRSLLDTDFFQSGFSSNCLSPIAGVAL